MSSVPPTNQHLMRVLGVLMMVFSFGEIGVGTYIYRFMTNVHLGGWWGVIVVFISGILAAVSNSRLVLIDLFRSLFDLVRPTVTAGCFLAILGVFSTLVSGVIDGIAASVFYNLTSCENTSTLKVYGADDDVALTDLKICMNDESADLPTHQCVCTDKSFCGYYRLSDSHNCGLILTLYSRCLIASTVLIGLSFIVALIYSIVSCRSVCADRPEKPTSSPTVREAMENRFSDVERADNAERARTNDNNDETKEEPEEESVEAVVPALPAAPAQANNGSSIAEVPASPTQQTASDSERATHDFAYALAPVEESDDDLD